MSDPGGSQVRMRLSGLTLRVFVSAAVRDRALREPSPEDGAGDAWTLDELVDRLRVEGGHSTARRARDEELRCAALQAYSSVPNAPEVAFGTLVETFQELKEAGLDPREVEAVGGPKLETLGALAARFEAALTVAGWTDRAGALLEAVERLESHGLPRGWKRYRGVELLGLWRLTPLQRRFLRSLAVRCEQAELPLRIEIPAAGVERIDGAVDSLFSELESVAQGLRFLELTKEDRIARGAPLAALAGRMFDLGSKERAPSPIPLEIEGLATPTHEADRIADAIGALIERGTRPEAIAVIYREAGPDARRLTQALRRRGIPMERGGGGEALSEPAAKASYRALELLSLGDEGFPAPRTGAVLSEVSPRAAALLARAGIRDDRFGAPGSRGAYAIRLQALATRSPPAVARELRALLQGFEALAGACGSIPARASVPTLLTAFWKGVQAARIFNRALEDGSLKPLEALVSRLIRGVRAASPEGIELSREACRQWISEELAHLAAGQGCLELELSGVAVTDVEAAVGRRFEHLFLVGLTEGNFPRWSRAQGSMGAAASLLRDADRSAINRWRGKDLLPTRSGWGDPSTSYALARERLLFYLALTSAERSVTATYARNGAGGEQAMSPFLESLCEVTSARVRQLPGFEVPNWDELRTEEALRERCGREWAANEPGHRARLEAIFGGVAWFEQLKSSAEAGVERARFAAARDRLESRFTGAIAPAALEGPLSHRFAFSRENPGSASWLSKLGNCAFQGFVAHGLGVREEEPPGEELDARNEGVFWHAVLESLLPRLRKEGLLGERAIRLPEPLLDAAVDQAWEKIATRVGGQHPALRALAKARARAMARRLFARPGGGLPLEGALPSRFEQRFGDERSGAGWRELRIPAAFPGEVDLYVHGVIDRLDEGEGVAAVIDYKSRAMESPGVLYQELLETEFQLPLYLYAARVAGLPASQAAWLSLKDGEALGLDRVLAQGEETVDSLLSVDRETREAMASANRKNLANAVHRLISAARDGRFGARPRDCERCAYASICRVSDEQDGSGGMADAA